MGEAPPLPICATTSGRYPSPGPNRRGSQPPTFSPPPPPPPAAELTDVPLDGNLPEAFLEAGVEGAGGAAAVPLGGGGHGGAEREHSGLPAAPAHFKSPASRWAGWPPPPSPPPALPGKRRRRCPLPRRGGLRAAPAVAELLPLVGLLRNGCLASEMEQGRCVQEVTVKRFHMLLRFALTYTGSPCCCLNYRRKLESILLSSLFLFFKKSLALGGGSH